MKFSWGREEVDGREVGLLDQQSSKSHPAMPLQPVMVSFDGRSKRV